MVLAERNTESIRNGRRGPSPNGNNGNCSPTSSSDEENSSKKIGSKSSKTKSSEYEAEKIRVGRDYQVCCPDLVPVPERKPDTLNDRALLVWSPTKDIPEIKLEEYISVAKEKYGYNGEQALGMLFWHKHDLERAVLDLANFTPFPDEWTVEDKVLFEQAFQFHGKSFHRIRQMLPDKSIASLVKYYYSWKKTRNRTSVMDRKEQIKKNEGSENGSENGSNEDSDNEEKKWPYHRGIRRASGSPPRGTNDDSNVTAAPTVPQVGNTTHGTISNTTSNGLNIEEKDSIKTSQQLLTNPNVTQIGTQNSIKYSTNNISSSASSSSNNSSNSTTSIFCAGCGVPCNQLNSTPQGKLCNSCFHHWRRTGQLRPTSGPSFGKRSKNGGNERHKRKPPRGMHINHDDIVALATDSEQANRNDQLLSSMDREIVSLWSQIQNNKQLVSSLKRKNTEIDETLRPSDNLNKMNSRWNNVELLLAVEGVKKYGKDFQAIAESIGNKTEAQIRTFFVNYRRRYNLDAVLKQHAAENVQPENLQNDSTVNAALGVNKVNGQETEIMEVDLDDESSPNHKEIELKSNGDVSIIPVDKMEPETLNISSSPEVSILSINNPKAVTAAK